MNNKSGLRYRFENFGGIIASDSPPFLAYVDKDYMLGLKLGKSPLWKNKNQTIGILSAPTEVHFSITNRCSSACSHCYMDGGLPDKNEFDTETIKRTLDVLAKMKVFHVAMGGGEALEHPDLFEIAKYARSVGITPNLTTSGKLITADNVKQMKIFGQVNLSIDGIHSLQNIFRQQDSFTMVDQTIDLLINAGVPTGINCVVGKRNFDGLEDIFKYANSKKINEVEFLRIKPSGRGKNLYLDEKTTHQQNIELIPKLTEYSETYKISAKIDCSFVPMYCYHNPPIDLLDSFATYGCEAGNILLGIRSNGEVSGCSFLPFSGLSVFDLEDNYSQKMYTAFGSLFNWTQNAPEPCKTCNYLQICKGGCHCVSEFVTGIMEAPDPDCPFVNEYNKKVKS